MSKLNFPGHSRPSAVPILGICAYASGTGKTTLLESILPILSSYGLKVSVIKQARMDFDVDQPGKDSHRLRKAGAQQVLLSSSKRWVLMTELDDEDPDDKEPTLHELVRHLGTAAPDLVLAEGFKTAAIPKIEVFRACRGKPLLACEDRHVIAVASDIDLASPAPVLDINNPWNIAKFIRNWLIMHKKALTEDKSPLFDESASPALACMQQAHP